MDPDAFQQDYQRWLNRFLNRPQSKIELEQLADKERARALYEVDCLEHMWALPEREEP